MSQALSPSLHEEAVAHAYVAERSGELMWKHIEAEYTQDVHQIADTLATGVPLAWILANDFSADGAVHFLTGETKDEIREQYEGLRTFMEIHHWDALLEIRQGWYTLSHGVCTAKRVPGGEFSKGETAVLFPVGEDGILGEIQIGIVGHLPGGGVPSDGGRLPEKRLAALAAEEAYRQALLAEDVEAIVAAHVPKAAVATRGYVTDESSLMKIEGAEAIRSYFTALFERFHVLDIRLVTRVAETWFTFSELHWIVEERSGGRTVEFCTADFTPIDAEGKYLLRTGAGTDPVEISGDSSGRTTW
jgi:hypothetical protein